MSETNFHFRSFPAQLDKASENAKKKILKSWGNLMESQTRKRLRDGKDVDGNPFAPRKFPDLVVNKSKRVLYEHGDMFRSIRSTFYINKVVTMSNVPYSAYHNEGRDYKASKKQSVWMWANLFGKKGSPFAIHNIKLPKREFLGFSKEDKDKLSKLASSILSKELKGG